MYFTGGTNYSSTEIPIDGTEDDTIYQSIRTGTFSYSIPVPAGTYEVSIHLAELYVIIFLNNRYLEMRCCCSLKHIESVPNLQGLYYGWHS